MGGAHRVTNNSAFPVRASPLSFSLALGVGMSTHDSPARKRKDLPHRNSTNGYHNETQLVVRVDTARLPTVYGEFQVTAYRDGEGKDHLVIGMGEPRGKPVLVRLHSECLTGDVLGSLRCDC